MFYVISDVHSNYKALMEIINQLDSKKDQLIINGDVLDRGNDGFLILDEIMNRSNIHLLLGNHEVSLLNTYISKEKNDEKQFESWKRYWFEGGGRKSYEYFFKKLAKEKQNKYLEYLFSCDYDMLLKIKGEYFYIVHACPSNDKWEMVADRRNIFSIIDNELDIIIEDGKDGYTIHRTKLTKEDKELLQNDEEKDYIINPTIIVGHNPTKYLQQNNPCEILKERNIINIDCGSHGYYNEKYDENGFIGRLACLCLNTMEVKYY